MKKKLMVAMCCICSLLATACNKTNSITVGILKLADHPALNQVEAGVIDALKENGYEEGKNITFDKQCPNGDSAINSSMANKLALSSDYLVGIATNAAGALKKAVKDAGKLTPILFSAVTDPVDAKLVTSIEKPGANITGTSDMGPVDKSLELLKTYFQTETKKTFKVGLLYNLAESNSIVQINTAKTTITTNGWTFVDSGISQDTEITTSVQALGAQNVDAIYIPTDNLIATAMQSVKNAVSQLITKPLVICGDVNMIETGGIVSLGVNYYSLGVQTGNMLAKVIKGEDTANMPVQYADKTPLTVNKKLATTWGITLPQKLLDDAESVIE